MRTTGEVSLKSLTEIIRKQMVSRTTDNGKQLSVWNRDNENLPICCWGWILRLFWRENFQEKEKVQIVYEGIKVFLVKHSSISNTSLTHSLQSPTSKVFGFPFNNFIWLPSKLKKDSRRSRFEFFWFPRSSNHLKFLLYTRKVSRQIKKISIYGEVSSMDFDISQEPLTKIAIKALDWSSIPIVLCILK